MINIFFFNKELEHDIVQLHQIQMDYWYQSFSIHCISWACLQMLGTRRHFSLRSCSQGLKAKVPLWYLLNQALSEGSIKNLLLTCSSTEAEVGPLREIPPF